MWFHSLDESAAGEGASLLHCRNKRCSRTCQLSMSTLETAHSEMIPRICMQHTSRRLPRSRVRSGRTSMVPRQLAAPHRHLRAARQLGVSHARQWEVVTIQ